MDNLLEAATPEGGFEVVKDLKGGPVPNEEVLENIRQSIFINAPLFKNKSPQKGSCIFIAGGPTVADYLDEIKERKSRGEFILTSNNTHDYLVDKGIIPDACVVMDPKEIVKKYIKKPQLTTQYYISTVVNKAVATQLVDAGCKVEKVLTAYGMEDEEDISLQKAVYHVTKDKLDTFLVGGTMTGLRVMPFAIQLGFSKLEYYGFDSCFSTKLEFVKKGEPDFDIMKSRNFGRSYDDVESGDEYAIKMEEGGEGIFYAYYKVRAENIQVAVTPDGRKFVTSPVFAHQAKQFPKWYDRMEGVLEIVVHGDSLSSHLLKCHLESKRKSKELIGDKRWSKTYEKMQMEMHEFYDKYGSDMVPKYKWLTLDIIGKAILTLHTKLRRNLTILDYGCGQGNMSETMSGIFKVIDVTSYDPFVERFSKEPEEVFDVVVCVDVMEHVEEQCVDNTIEFISKHCKNMAVFVIALHDAKKDLVDGRNAHITQKNPMWWVQKLQQHNFIVGEAIKTGEEGKRAALFAVCQSVPGRAEFYAEVKKLKSGGELLENEPEIEKVA